MVFKKTKDHWAFLEEIEAPTWIDLTLENPNSNIQEIDDEWFYTSHTFHQCSSRQLKTVFSGSGEDAVDLDFDSLGSSSPKLPLSVSRSRGKDYGSNKWTDGKRVASLNNPHPVKVLTGKSSKVDLGPYEKVKPRSSLMKPKPSRVDLGHGEEIKPKLSFINLSRNCSKKSYVCESSSSGNSHRPSLRPISTLNKTGTTCSKKSFVSESSLTGNTDRNSLRSISSVDKVSESRSSTVTTESSLQPPQNILETSSQAFGHTSGLLSAVRISLRKSCVTRQASRVENKRESTADINEDGRDSTSRKSSSSKSSVGSSSIITHDLKSSKCTVIKERTPDSRNLRGFTETATKNMNVHSVKVSTLQVKDKAINSQRKDITNFAKSTHTETAKPKVQFRNNSSVPLRVRGQNSIVGNNKAMEKVGKLNRGGSKENPAEKKLISQKYRGKENATGSTIRGQSGSKEKMVQKIDKRGLTGPKGKVIDGIGGNKMLNMSQRIHLR